MKQVINTKGTNIYPGQVKLVWVATCSCGNKLVRAMKESGLKMYVGKERFSCKQCGKRLQKKGQHYFKGDQMISREQVWAATDFDED
ncbi:hypothetical protein [Paenibacillus sp. FSL H7-0323]|uniref:hypothetical protein n=1 Tax=Paenibacillus sp. FSL H7-0323 TaxID=2921433 RepID=UPI0030F84F72